MKLNRRHAIIHTLSFITPIALVLFLLARLGITPFGGGSFLRADMDSQYSAFLSYLRSILRGDNDLFYSFSMNGGGNFYFLYTYYLANPFNWLMALVPAEDIPHALTFFILVRFGLAGLTMSLYLRRIQPQSFSFRSLIFSTSYALMTYTVAYAENFFFIDGVIMLPLVLIGIEDLFERRTVVPYTLLLGCTLFIQFYIGWMICIFSLIYFLFKLAQAQPGERAQALRRFVYSSLLAGCLAAIILLPTFRSLLGSVKEPSKALSLIRTNFPFFHLLSQLQTGVYRSEDWKQGLPNIYSGALMTVLAIAFFGQRTIERREKLLTAAVFLFLWISFYLDWINIIWHGFSEPKWYSYRYAFIFSFWIIRTAYRANIHLLKSVSIIQAAALSVIVALNLTSNGYWIWRENLSISSTVNSYRSHVQTLTPILESIRPSNEDFGRIENLAARDTNDPMRFNYNGLSHFSSTSARDRVLTPLQRLGIQSYFYKTQFTSGTPQAAVSLFGIRYVIGRDFAANPVSTALPLAFFVPGTIIRATYSLNNPYENLNNFFPLLSGSDSGAIYLPVNTVSKTDETTGTIWELPAEVKHPIYMFTKGVDTLPNRIDGSTESGEIAFFTDESILLGTVIDGRRMTVASSANGGINGTDEPAPRYFYSENLDALSAYARVIQPRGVPVDKVTSSHLRLRLESTGEFPYLFLSIFYDEGWRATIDGQDAPIYPALNYFMMIPIDGGAHTVELRYTPPGFRLGACLSLAGCLLLMLIAWRERRAHS